MKKCGFILSCKTHSSDSSPESSQDALHARAFTLAEVLLTLAIIGVVAALTIPAVVTKVTQDQYVVALKKAFNTLKSVERAAIQENGEMQNWDFSKDAKTTFETYFKPHFDILKDCGATTDDGCFASKSDYKFLDGNNSGTEINNDAAKIITSDGISYAYEKLSIVPLARVAQIIVDLNGKKRPNMWGRDLFAFDVFPSSIGIKPHGSYVVTGTGEKIETSIVNSNCSISSQNNWYCTVKVLSEGAMNY